MVTAKVKCVSKLPSGDGSTRQVLVQFQPDYTDGRNKEWAAATPHLALQMTLNDSAADLFEQGKAYTLQFVENEA